MFKQLTFSQFSTSLQNLYASAGLWKWLCSYKHRWESAWMYHHHPSFKQAKSKPRIATFSRLKENLNNLPWLLWFVWQITASPPSSNKLVMWLKHWGTLDAHKADMVMMKVIARRESKRSVQEKQGSESCGDSGPGRPLSQPGISHRAERWADYCFITLQQTQSVVRNLTLPRESTFQL